MQSCSLSCDLHVKVKLQEYDNVAIPRRRAVKDTNCISLKASETVSSWKAEKNFDAIPIKEDPSPPSNTPYSVCKSIIEHGK